MHVNTSNIYRIGYKPGALPSAKCFKPQAESLTFKNINCSKFKPKASSGQLAVGGPVKHVDGIGRIGDRDKMLEVQEARCHRRLSSRASICEWVSASWDWGRNCIARRVAIRFDPRRGVGHVVRDDMHDGYSCAAVCTPLAHACIVGSAGAGAVRDSASAVATCSCWSVGHHRCNHSTLCCTAALRCGPSLT